MILTFTIFILYNIYTLFVNHKSRNLTWLFIITLLFGTVIVLLQIYIAKFIYYTPELYETKTSFIFSLDKYFWSQVKDFLVGANTINRLINIFSALFIYAFTLYSIYYCMEKITRRMKLALMLLLILPIEIILFYDPIISFYIFIRVSSGLGFIDSNTILFFIRVLERINYFAINLCFAFSLAILIRRIFQTKLKINRNQTLFILGQLMPLALIFLLVFVWFPEKNIDINNYLVRLAFVPSDFTVPYLFFEYLPVFASVFIAINIYQILSHQIWNAPTFWSKNNVSKFLNVS